MVHNKTLIASPITNGTNLVCSVIVLDHERIQPLLGDRCGRLPFNRGVCNTHYWRNYRTGTTEASQHGKGSLRKDGYITRSVKGKRVRAHRLVMEEVLGRPLFADEKVHHKNGDRADNNPTNLELWSTSQPPGQRVEDKIIWAKELLARYNVTLILHDTHCKRRG